VGGLFIETRKACTVGATVELHFLVEDGEIKANATVRYVKAGGEWVCNSKRFAVKISHVSRQ
jgi:hypothetical protein